MIHPFRGVIPTKFKGRDGVEKTAWKDAGFEMIYDDQKDHYWGRFVWWPEGVRMLIQPPRENNQRGASGYNQAPQGQTQERPLVQEAEDESLPF